MSRISFTNRRGEKLSGILHGEMSRGVAVITCHGMFSDKDGRKQQALAAALQAMDLPTLRFDFAGCGESDGTMFDLSYTHRMEDLDAAIDFLWQRGAKAIGLFGSSMGGAVAYLTAARDERVVAVATIAAVGQTAALVESHPDMIDMFMERGYADSPKGKIGVHFLEDSRAHDVPAAVSILRAPILVIHGEQDDVVPPSDAHDIAAAARSASLDLVMGADHEFSRLSHMRPAIARVAQFLAGALNSAMLQGRG